MPTYGQLVIFLKMNVKKVTQNLSNFFITKHKQLWQLSLKQVEAQIYQRK
jgi:hypothetical protein